LAVINDIVERMAAWLRGQVFTPAVRVVSPVELRPPTVYPQVTIFVDDEVFGPTDADVTARLRLRVTHAGGRPADTQRDVRSLAHQLRVALCSSHTLGGTVKRLRTGDLQYGAENAGSGTEPIVLRADLGLQVKYCVGLTAS
jgi:hypothetical protein